MLDDTTRTATLGLALTPRRTIPRRKTGALRPRRLTVKLLDRLEPETTKLGDSSCQADISTLFAKPKAGKGKPARELSETTKTRLKTIPGAEALVERMASNAK